MSVLRLTRAIGFALAAVILAVSGAYVVIDLARWEWNRAIVSALVFLCALVILVGMMLFTQMRRLELRMEALEQRPRDAADTLGAIRAGTAHGHRFRWLERPPDRVAVFIPVLLGAGAMLSFIAYLVERIAGAFAASTLDPRTVRALAPDLPLGPGMAEPTAGTVDPHAPRRPALRIAGIAVTLVLAVVLVQALRELTQSRPDELTAPGTTTIVLDVGQRREIRPVAVATADLWTSCRSRVSGPIEVSSITPLGRDRVRLDLDRALGRTGRARIVGCMKDYTLDLVRADVVSIETFPAASGAQDA